MAFRSRVSQFTGRGKEKMHSSLRGSGGGDVDGERPGKNIRVWISWKLAQGVPDVLPKLRLGLGFVVGVGVGDGFAELRASAGLRLEDASGVALEVPTFHGSCRGILSCFRL